MIEQGRQIYKIIFSDVDGTLLPNNSLQLPSPRVTKAMRAASKLSATGLATARQPQKSLYLIDHLELSGYSVLSNGAQIYDPVRRQMVRERIIDPTTTIEIAERLRADEVSFWIQDGGIDQPFTPQYRPEKPFVIVAHKVGREIEAQLLALYGHQYPLTAFRAHLFDDDTRDVFITDVASNKRSAMLEVAEMLDVSTDEILAIGDGPNDKVLLETAGYGVAMANGVEETKAIASVIVPSVDNDGVAVALERFVL